jgi:hypothetical protein
MQNPPTLSKLDRVLLNPQWDSIIPNTVVSSLPRTTSDHYPLKVDISTNTPKPQIFRYCNNWKFKQGFKELVHSSWSTSFQQSDAAGTLVHKLRTSRQKARAWKKTLNPDKVILETAKKIYGSNGLDRRKKETNNP